MKLSVQMTRDRLTDTLRWIGMQAAADAPREHAETPDRFAKAARRAARRGFGDRP
jgi:hypothetical protein